MALIIKCRDCGRLIREAEAACLSCGPSDLPDIVDTLPKLVTTLEEAHDWEKLITSASHKKKVVSTPTKATAADLFQDFPGVVSKVAFDICHGCGDMRLTTARYFR